jgi:hypothetical protein
MRKLAPLVLFASLAALVGGTTFAATGPTNSGSPDKATGSPSVQANTNNPAGMSYSDKSSTSPGTNAKMDDTTAVTPGHMDGAGIAMDEDGKITTGKKTAEPVRKHKAKLAKSDLTKRAPADSTNGAAANSTSGTPAGGS